MSLAIVLTTIHETQPAIDQGVRAPRRQQGREDSVPEAYCHELLQR